MVFVLMFQSFQQDFAMGKQMLFLILSMLDTLIKKSSILDTELHCTEFISTMKGNCLCHTGLFREKNCQFFDLPLW